MRKRRLTRWPIFLDAILPLDKMIPGELGKLAEAADGPIFEEVVGALAKLFKTDPIKKAARRARRRERQASRQARRTARRAARLAKKNARKD